MRTAAHRSPTRRRATTGGMFDHRADEALLDSPYGQKLLARIDQATTEFVADRFDRTNHVRRIALVCLKAKHG